MPNTYRDQFADLHDPLVGGSRKSAHFICGRIGARELRATVPRAMPWADLLRPCRAQRPNMHDPRAMPWADMLRPCRAERPNMHDPRAMPWADMLRPCRARRPNMHVARAMPWADILRPCRARTKMCKTKAWAPGREPPVGRDGNSLKWYHFVPICIHVLVNRASVRK